MRRRIAPRATAAAAVGTTLVISLTACMGDSGSGSGTSGNIKLTAADALVKTSQKAGQADTFKAELTVTDSGNGGTKVKASGQFKLRPALTFSATLNEFSRGGQTLPGANSQAILVGNALYAKVPQLAQLVSGGKAWVKVDINQVGKRNGFDLGQLTTTVQKIDPAEQSKMITGSKDARRVGEETVDGTKTTHYTGTVTVADALGKLDATAREKVRQWHPNGSEKLSFDVWVDKNQLPRKLVSKGAPDGGGTSTITVLYSDYGKKVTVNAPPADQVGDISSRIGQFLGGN